MATPNQIVMDGFPFGIFTFTYALTGVAATDAAVAATFGKVVTLDKAVAEGGAVKLAGDGDPIFGRIYVAENRAILNMRTASVARFFKERVPAAVNHGIVVGDRIVGAGNGLVKKDAAAAATNPIVVAVGTDYVIAEML